MTPRRRQRLVLVGLLLAGIGITVGLALMALNENINLFFSPSQIAAGESPANAAFRVGGLVEDGSVERPGEGLTVHFRLTDTATSVPVAYTGILPDLFREGQGIIAQGRMGPDGVFQADEVLAKHDENYMPPEVEEAIHNAVGEQMK